jgi:hypothetical protein
MAASSWPFSTIPALAAALNLTSEASSIGNRRFPARNFRLERQVPMGRVMSYASIVNIPDNSVDASSAFNELNRLHNRYLEILINLGTRMNKFDQVSENCPESFRVALHLDEFGHSEDNLFLARVEDLDFIARRSGVSKNELRQIVGDVAISNRSDDADESNWAPLTDILQRWHDSLDNRPTFAAYWEDAQSLLTDPKPGWAEEIRDRLGLLHYEPARKPDREMDVIVFRYPVRLIPRFDRSSPRLLLRPTVLDGPLSEAFCTAPSGTGVGSTIDLAGRDDDPWQEVVHPPVELKPEHVWAIDTITASPPADLARSRALHIIKLCLRATPEFQDLCTAIDRDLI